MRWQSCGGSGTKAWANIQGATSFKFGIYFGRTKSDPKRKYRFTEKFGSTEAQAFAAVKSALLDQALIAGLGNIYVDESLFLAGIHPLRRSDRRHIWPPSWV